MRYILEGLDCANCAMKIEAELQKVSGLEGIKINFATRSLEMDPEYMETAARIIGRIEPGVKLVPPDRKKSDIARTGINEEKRLILAGILFLIGLVFNQPLHQTPFSWLEYLTLLPSYFLVGWPVLRRAFQKIIRGELFDENFLMAIATMGAIAIHQLAEAVGVMLFYALGEYYQGKAVGRSRRSIKALLDIQPEYANLFVDGSGILRVSPDEVQVDQTILIKPGEKVPLDGKILEGESLADTSALTGESVPRRLMAGDQILAGMINGGGLLTVKVTAPYRESSIARILTLVEKASERKAPAEQFITSFAHYYSPLVVALAVMTAIIPPLVLPGTTWNQWIYRALVLLVISCPCALVISIPLSYFGGLGGASRHGILVKGANFLDIMARLHTVVFDKTGTLTQGVFKVTEIVAQNGYTKEELLRIAAEAEVYSNHPIAHSIREAYGKEISTESVTEYREIPAHGISALVAGKRVLAGNDRLMHLQGIVHHDCQVEGTIVYLAVDSVYAGYIIIDDEIKEDAYQAISDLRKLGVQKIYMLTGDDQTVARSVAAKLGLDGYYAELLPEDKVARIEELLSAIPHSSHSKLAFVGDGVNDAPVITRADLGVAMGALGSPAAISAADLVLMDDRPSQLGVGLRLARRTRKIVYQNIYVALGVKAFFILLGSMGVASIWEAVFADVGVTLIAVFNAMRTMKRNVIKQFG